MKFGIYRSLILTLFFFGSSAIADISFEATTHQGRGMVLTFSGDRVTQSTGSALLCIENSPRIDEVKLWMPEHNHGTTPTQLVLENDCVRVRRINFVMSGLWEFRVQMHDQDRGVIRVQVD